MPPPFASDEEGDASVFSPGFVATSSRFLSLDSSSRASVAGDCPGATALTVAGASACFMSAGPLLCAARLGPSLLPLLVVPAGSVSFVGKHELSFSMATGAAAEEEGDLAAGEDASPPPRRLGGTYCVHACRGFLWLPGAAAAEGAFVRRDGTGVGWSEGFLVLLP